jgi:2-polyprenyl-6-methoxyphenol hydroxylase-like FAD-dependent oxidoreductase
VLVCFQLVLIRLLFLSQRIGKNLLLTGFAGLAAAYTLARAGHKVRVLDQQPSFGSNVSSLFFVEIWNLISCVHLLQSQCTAGIKVGPNLTRVLRDWGLGDTLAAVTGMTKRSGYVSRKSLIEIKKPFISFPAKYIDASVYFSCMRNHFIQLRPAKLSITSIGMTL